MIFNYFFIRLYLILASFVSRNVARVAIVGGELAKIQDVAYQVALVIKNQDECGGGIIDELHILTAAHCVVLDNGDITHEFITIVAGAQDIQKIDKHTVKVQVQKIFVPREFAIDDIHSNGDIAVLKLQHHLNLKKHHHLKSLKLPKHEHEHYFGQTARVAGFGWNWIKSWTVSGTIRRNGGNTDTNLRYAKADVLDDLECHDNYKIQKLIKPDKEFCARVKQRDHINPHGVCSGDSGSPLVVDETQVIGILSSGAPSCSEKLRPGLYTRVAHYLSFIEHAKHDKPHHDIITRDLYQ